MAFTVFVGCDGRRAATVHNNSGTHVRALIFIVQLFSLCTYFHCALAFFFLLFCSGFDCWVCFLFLFFCALHVCCHVDTNICCVCACFLLCL